MLQYFLFCINTRRQFSHQMFFVLVLWNHLTTTKILGERYLKIVVRGSLRTNRVAMGTKRVHVSSVGLVSSVDVAYGSCHWPRRCGGPLIHFGNKSHLVGGRLELPGHPQLRICPTTSSASCGYFRESPFVAAGHHSPSHKKLSVKATLPMSIHLP